MMIMMITGMSLVKISVGFFLLRFLGHTWLRLIIIGMQGSSTQLYICYKTESITNLRCSLHRSIHHRL